MESGRASGPLVPTGSAERWLLDAERERTAPADCGRAPKRCWSEGALDEVARSPPSALDPVLPAMKAIGVRELLAHERGDLSLDEAVAAMKTETRRYAKRQMTWFRNQMADWRQVGKRRSA